MQYLTLLIISVLAVAVFVVTFTKTEGSDAVRGLTALGMLGAYAAVGPALIIALLNQTDNLGRLATFALAGQAMWITLFSFTALAVAEFLGKKASSANRKED